MYDWVKVAEGKIMRDRAPKLEHLAKIAKKIADCIGTSENPNGPATVPWSLIRKLRDAIRDLEQS
jgi:hypothetical protein